MKNRLWRTVLAAAGCAAVALALCSKGGIEAWGADAGLFAVGLSNPTAMLTMLLAPPEPKPTPVAPDVPAVSQTQWSGAEQAPMPEVGAYPQEVPEEMGNGGRVVEQKMTTGDNKVDGVAIKNKSNKTIDIAAELAVEPDVHLTDTDQPQVLIFHTHTTEKFMDYYAGYYNKGDGGRTTDQRKNVVAVGEEIARQLRAKGINVIHDATMHDYPAYSGAYSRSVKTVEEIMKKYPTIQVVLDIHRDGIMLNETDKVKPTVVIGGKKAAQMSMICGVNSTEKSPHPHWQENLRFALRLQQAVHNAYPGLIRPLGITNSRYNQHMAKGALLLEMGSEGNTLEEAMYTARMLGEVLGGVLIDLKK